MMAIVLSYDNVGSRLSSECQNGMPHYAVNTTHDWGGGGGGGGGGQ